MARYSAFNTNTNTASTTVPMSCLTGGTSGRVRLYHLLIGSPATPGNQAAQFAIRRTTARGTQSASFTPKPLDPADVACNATWDSAWAANPTITAASDLLVIAMNQQASWQWMVDPTYGLVIPATAGNGLALLSDATTSAASFLYNGFFKE